MDIIWWLGNTLIWEDTVVVLVNLNEAPIKAYVLQTLRSVS